jgi:drug/metabolite transporter (DMT)-like permease
VAPFSYVQIIAAVVFGALVFGQLPDTWTLAGITLVVLAGVYVLRRQTG